MTAGPIDYDDPNLTPQEEWLVACAREGEWWGAWTRLKSSPGPNPVSRDPWDKSRVLRASVICALAAGENWPGRSAPWPVSPKGVRVGGAWIWGDLDFEGATVERTIWLHNSAFDGAIALRDAKTKTFSLTGSYASKLFFSRSKIEGHLYLREGSFAGEEVNLVGATIDGQLSCTKGIFDNPNGRALNCNSLTVGDVYLSEGFSAKGEVHFVGASIKGSLICDNASFDNPEGVALDCDALTVGVDAFLRYGFSARGEVNFRGATIGHQLDCTNATFDQPDGTALNCDALVVGADVFLRHGFLAKGRVDFIGAKIGSDMRCTRATFDNAAGDAFDLTLAEIGAGLFIHGLTPAQGGGSGMNGRLSLAQASCRTFHDDSKSWPEPGKLVLDGFTYERFDESDTGWRRRSEWLKRQTADHRSKAFRPQPWTQAINVLRAMGHDSDARRLAVCRENARLRARSTGWFTKLRLAFSYLTVGYGYRPWLALVWSALFVGAGWWVFASAASLGYMAPRDSGVRKSDEWNAPAKVHLAQPALPRTYPPFNGLVYALDGYLPVIEFDQDESWEPSSVKTIPVIHSAPDWTLMTYVPKPPEWFFQKGWHRAVYWANEILGWLFITLFITGVSGLMKKE